ncbi:MAG: hypothetical protein V2I66_00720 [Halieaceae bacterium]|jgi:hypothetical protein|nr:hypothetical protein [Halieaceae bacterium]
MKNFTRAGFFAGAIVLSTLGSASLHSSTASVESKSYLLKVSNVMEAAQLVESVGGNVTETAASISYLGATLTQEQLQLLSRSELVVRISEHQVADADEFAPGSEEVAGSIWKTNNVAGSIWKILRASRRA